jgi:WD40 repeat protein
MLILRSCNSFVKSLWPSPSDAPCTDDSACGVCVQILTGHEGPVVSVAFSPSPASTALASVSWDKTLKLWNAVECGSNHETIQLTADGMCSRNSQ